METAELVGHRAIGEHQELRRERRHAARLARGVLVRNVLGGEVAQCLRRGGRRLTADMEHGNQPWNPTRLADGILVGLIGDGEVAQYGGCAHGCHARRRHHGECCDERFDGTTRAKRVLVACARREVLDHAERRLCDSQLDWLRFESSASLDVLRKDLERSRLAEQSLHIRAACKWMHHLENAEMHTQAWPAQ
jgi:hypothetical protein